MSKHANTLLKAAITLEPFFLAVNTAINPAALNLDAAQRGEIYAANDSTFNATFLSQPLTNYAAGWRDPENLDDQLEFLAPEVPAARRFEYREYLNSEEFFAELNNEDVRTRGADFKKVEYNGIPRQGRVANKGLSIVLENDELAENPALKTIQTNALLRRLTRNELLRAYSLLLAAAVQTGYTWSGTSDPDADVTNELILAANISGIRPSRVAYGESAWVKRWQTYRGQNTAGGFSSAGQTPEMLSATLGSEVQKITARYQSAVATKTNIAGASVLTFLAEKGASKEDPSNVKRFTAPVEGGGRYRVYEQRLDAKRTLISVEVNQSTVLTSTLGVRALLIS